MVTFKGFPAVVTASFECPKCGKKNRTRKFRAECTVNPLNKNEDGSIKSPAEVLRQSQVRAVEEMDKFLVKPLCTTCERGLTYAERNGLFEERRNAIRCPICAGPFKPEDTCASDITEGTCHAACLEGSPVVDLDTGEEIPGGRLDTYPYSEIMDQAAAPAGGPAPSSTTGAVA